VKEVTTRLRPAPLVDTAGVDRDGTIDSRITARCYTACVAEFPSMGIKSAACGGVHPRQQQRHRVADPDHDTARGLTAVLGRGRVAGNPQCGVCRRRHIGPRVSYAVVEASDDGRAADGKVVSVISIHTARYGNTTIGDATVLGRSGDRAGRYVPDRLHRCEQIERMSRDSGGRDPLLVSR
jgi:hypothetical protein